MNHYILDTGFFIISRDYYPDTFPAFWKKLKDAVVQGLVSSVYEVKKELEQYGGEQKHLLSWIDNNKDIFTKPTEEELESVRKIFKVKDFTLLISKQDLLKGSHFADPFVIAKAMVKQAAVVTREKPVSRDNKGKPKGSPKIPDVCGHFGIRCLSPENFMRQEKWRF